MSQALNALIAPWDVLPRPLRRSRPAPLDRRPNLGAEAEGAEADLAWLSLSAVNEGVDVDRDICHLALVATERDKRESLTARRLM